MYFLTEHIANLYDILIGERPSGEESLIKMHTRCLEELGDLSFPIPMKNWYHFVKRAPNESETIFGYRMNQEDVESALKIIMKSVKIRQYKVIKTSAHLFLERPLVFQSGIQKVLIDQDSYGKWPLLIKHIKLVITNANVDDGSLTTLRLHILKTTLENLIKLTADLDSPEVLYVFLTQNGNMENNNPTILCGPVINEHGVKNTEHKAWDVFDKRISDMQMMAQHRYRVNVKPSSEWNKLFDRLGKSSVTLELLSNKPHKSLKISLNDLSGSNKGPAFIFYNCARLSVLLSEFDRKVNQNIYPCLPTVDEIDFSLLNQPEEWELLFVYILQFPYMIKSCVRSLDKGIVNPQHLVTFLSNLCSTFSVYYRRVRILTDPRNHMFAIIHTRVYLLKALQFVFHNTLNVLNIEPVREMYIEVLSYL